MVRLSEGERAALDALAQSLGVTAPEVVRQLLRSRSGSPSLLGEKSQTRFIGDPPSDDPPQCTCPGLSSALCPIHPPKKDIK
jgi:hypothetical protein